MYILIYWEGVSWELNYEAILAIITTFYIGLGVIFHIGRLLVPIKAAIERMRTPNQIANLHTDEIIVEDKTIKTIIAT